MLWINMSVFLFGLVQSVSTETSRACFGVGVGCSQHRLDCTTGKIAIQKALFTNSSSCPSTGQNICKDNPQDNDGRGHLPFNETLLNELYNNCSFKKSCRLKGRRFIFPSTAIWAHSVIKYECIKDKMTLPLCGTELDLVNATISNIRMRTRSITCSGHIRAVERISITSLELRNKNVSKLEETCRKLFIEANGIPYRFNCTRLWPFQRLILNSNVTINITVKEVNSKDVIWIKIEKYVGGTTTRPSPAVSFPSLEGTTTFPSSAVTFPGESTAVSSPSQSNIGGVVGGVVVCVLVIIGGAIAAFVFFRRRRASKRPDIYMETSKTKSDDRQYDYITTNDCKLSLDKSDVIKKTVVRNEYHEIEGPVKLNNYHEAKPQDGTYALAKPSGRNNYHLSTNIQRSDYDLASSNTGFNSHPKTFASNSVTDEDDYNHLNGHTNQNTHYEADYDTAVQSNANTTRSKDGEAEDDYNLLQRQMLQQATSNDYDTTPSASKDVPDSGLKEDDYDHVQRGKGTHTVDSPYNTTGKDGGDEYSLAQEI